MAIYTTYKVESRELLMLKEMTLNERIKWIREKANEYNPSAFSMYRLSEKLGVNQSVLSRTEMDVAPKFTLVDAIAKELGVSTEVFSDGYYESSPAPFVICERLVERGADEGEAVSDSLNLFDAAYEVDIKVHIKSLSSEYVEELSDAFEISSLDYEEVRDQIISYIELMKKRRIRWKSKQNALNKLLYGNGGVGDEYPEDNSI